MTEDKLVLEGIFQKGYGVIPRLVMQDNTLDIGAKGFYAYLCSCTGTENTCYPSREKICRDLNISKDTLGKYSAQLVNAGYLRIDKVRENGRYSHNLYVILTNSLSPCPEFSDMEEPCPNFSDMAEPCPEKPCPEKPCPEKPCPKKPCPKNPDTINNSIINNSIINNNYSDIENQDIRERGTHEKSRHGEPEQPSQANTAPEKAPRTSSRFVPPTLEEVAAYCRERQSTVSAESFHDFYSANGWVQGKGKPIKDWRAAVRTWERRDRENGKRFIPPENKPEDDVIMPF